jgi:hypothetical protein
MKQHPADAEVQGSGCWALEWFAYDNQANAQAIAASGGVGAGDAAGAGVEVEVEVVVGTVVEPVGTVGVVGWMAPADGRWGGGEML